MKELPLIPGHEVAGGWLLIPGLTFQRFREGDEVLVSFCIPL